MKVIFLIINLIMSLYGTAPVFTTYETLPEDRQNQIYVTIECGICIDDAGNGMLINENGECGYISYRNIDNVHRGDVVYTLCVLNPETNYFDDIICRIDVIAGTEKIFINWE